MSGLGRHTVDAPVGLAVVVADGDAEPAMIGDDDRDDGYGDGDNDDGDGDDGCCDDAEPSIVGAHNLDGLLGLARHHHLVALARVPSPDCRLARCLATCNKDESVSETVRICRRRQTNKS